MSFLCPFIDIKPNTTQITPKINNTIGMLKDQIIFEEIMPIMYHNQDFVDFVNASNYKFIPLMDYYNKEVAVYFDIHGGTYNITVDDIIYTINIYFYTIKNVELLTSEIINKFFLIFEYNYFVANNILKPTWHDYRLNTHFIDNLNKQTFNNIKFTKPDYCRTELFNHQKNNIARMLDIHHNPTPISISDNMPIYFENGLICEIARRKFISPDEIPLFNISSGMILDEPGTGKTLQFILYLLECKKKSLVLVPNYHIKSHWINEYRRHILLDTIPFDILTFDELVEHGYDSLNDYEIIGIDEIHNLYKHNTEIFIKIIESPIKHRWGITGTPFVSDISFFQIMKFLTGYNLKNVRIAHAPYLQDQFMKLFIKNCKIDITEYDWAELSIEDIYVKLDVLQQRLYDAEKMLHNRDNLRKLVCEINLISQDGELKTPSELKQFGIQRYKNLYEIEMNKLKDLEQKLKNIQDNKDTFIEEEYNKRLDHYKMLILKQTEITDKTQKVYEFFMTGIEEINKIATKAPSEDDSCDDSERCPICFGSYSFPITYIKSCGHYFCKSCIDSMKHIARIDTCPLCRTELKSEDIINVNNISDINNSSKIHELLKVIKDEKYIIFTQFDKVIDKIQTFLFRNGITSATINNYTDEQILLLSTNQNAEGLNLSHFDKMIIFEPFEDNVYCSEVEKQLIARIHRIGREIPVIVYRFITEGTIEEEIYSKMK
jgi:SNF2 family DNA or RNA helicase